jgi:hypothetical protein
MICPSFWNQCPSEILRARGMPGAGRTHGPPATKKAGGSHHRFSLNNRHSPHNGVTAYTCSRRCTGLVSHRRSAQRLAELDPSVGETRPHDFAVRIGHVRQPCQPVHRILHPTFVTIAKRPSYRVRDSRINTQFLIFVNINFCCRGLRVADPLQRLAKSVFRSTRFRAVFGRARTRTGRNRSK